MNPPILLKLALRWTLRATVVGLLVGTASALFLCALEFVTDLREAHSWLVYGLPIAGVGIVWLYLTYGKGSENGNQLLLEEIHEPRGFLPGRMGFLIFLSTVVSHLFGAPVGREGTAVQMAGSISDALSSFFEIPAEDRRLLLILAIAAGFASVFGTPIGGAVFAIEVLAFGRVRYDALFPCVVAAVVAHWTTLTWGVHHAPYPNLDGVISGQLRTLSGAPTVTSVMIAIGTGFLFGGVARFFVSAIHVVQTQSQRWLKNPYFRIATGALLIVGVYALTGSTRFLGLGLPTIAESFHMAVPPWDFAAKLGLTALAIGVGFKGGEVTPLFFIGATLGSALSAILPMPPSVLSALGLTTVFASAANTPLAGVLIAVELFGSKIGVLAALSGVAGYLASGHTGIYSSQRVGYPKHAGFSSHEGLSVGSISSASRGKS